MPFAYTEEQEKVVMPEMGKQCPFQAARFCLQEGCQLWTDGECAFVRIAWSLHGMRWEG